MTITLRWESDRPISNLDIGKATRESRSRAEYSRVANTMPVAAIIDRKYRLLLPLCQDRVVYFDKEARTASGHDNAVLSALKRGSQKVRRPIRLGTTVPYPLLS